MELSFRQLTLNIFGLAPKQRLATRSTNTRTISRPADDSVSLSKIWNRLIDQYFPEKQELKNYKIVWSNRHQKRVLASCNIISKTVRVAPAMRHSDATHFIEPLLYHELCHAVLGFKMEKGRRIFHSKEFRSLELRHPQITLLDSWIKQGGWNRSVRLSRS